MIDIDYLIKYRAEYEQSARDRNLDVKSLKIDEIIDLHQRRKLFIAKIDDLRNQRNQLTKKIESNPLKDKNLQLIEHLRKIKQELQKLEKELNLIESSYRQLILFLPNIMSPEMPRGKDANDNVVVKKWGKIPRFDFQIKDHIELGKINDLIDIEKSAKVSGSRFYYLKNDLVLMQFALFSFVLKKLIKKGLSPIIPPVIVKKMALEGTGYLPFENDNVYQVKISGDKDFSKEQNSQDDQAKYLVGTSEVSIVSYHQGETFKVEQLPKKYVGYSPCFRTEVGSWGKDVKGIKRVHQFDKIEIIYFTTQETSQDLMKEVLNIEEEILQDLNLPYRVLDMCSGDVGMPTYRKFDLEVWLPSQETYMEVMSNSDLWEYQARRLNIKYKDKDNKSKYCHTISATAITNTRPLLAILENYQQKNGQIIVPEVLREYMGKSVIGKPD